MIGRRDTVPLVIECESKEEAQRIAEILQAGIPDFTFHWGWDVNDKSRWRVSVSRRDHRAPVGDERRYWRAVAHGVRLGLSHKEQT